MAGTNLVNRTKLISSLANELVEPFNELSKNPSKDKVIIPYETSEFIGGLSVMSDFLGKTSHSKS